MGINLLLVSLVLCPSPRPGRKGEPPVPQSRLSFHPWAYFPERNPYSNCRVMRFAFNNKHILQRWFHRWNPSKSNLMFPITLHEYYLHFWRQNQKVFLAWNVQSRKSTDTKTKITCNLTTLRLILDCNQTFITCLDIQTHVLTKIG